MLLCQSVARSLDSCGAINSPSRSLTGMLSDSSRPDNERHKILFLSNFKTGKLVSVSITNIHEHVKGIVHLKKNKKKSVNKYSPSCHSKLLWYDLRHTKEVTLKNFSAFLTIQSVKVVQKFQKGHKGTLLKTNIFIYRLLKQEKYRAGCCPSGIDRSFWWL